MALDLEKLKDKIESGIIFYLGARAVEEISNRFGRKYLAEHSELAAGLGLGIAIDMVMPKTVSGEMRTIIEDITDAAGDYGIYKEFRYLVDKEPVCWAKDANTLVCKNFEDLANATVIIDGTQLASDAYTVSGEEIQLSNALSSGEHTVVIVDGTKKKSFSGKVYV